MKTNADPTAQLDEDTWFVSAEKVYPQAVKGRFRTIKWAILFVTLGIYYFLPFVRWDRGAGAPDQAVLIDFEARRAYFFFIEIWPQEVYYLTGLLVIAAVALFLMNAVAGRVWCGYLCPQTVWTDLFMKVERFFEGDRRDRINLDKEPWTGTKIARKTGKHTVWLLIAWWTGGAWVLYFADAPTLVYELATGQASLIVYGWIAILTFTTYSLAGHMREQICTYMCPWPRIQAALTDEYALNVTYRADRGEPRGHLKENKKRLEEGLPAGDCIDCHQCVAVCPTGVDIRKGSQLECIQCGLCIDACDNIMTKVGKPTGLIAYDTDINMDRREQGLDPIYRFVRPRTIIYVGIIVIAAGIMLYTLINRQMMDLSVVHDRNPLYVTQNEGVVRNGYTLRLLNKESSAQDFTLMVRSQDGNFRAEVVGEDTNSDGSITLEVGADRTRQVRALVFSEPNATLPVSSALDFVLTNNETGESVLITDFFRTAEHTTQ
ncbi:cytochrome c oxidase accessory protein CcoG [Pseudovibrio sp. SPO723]|uniref:cytochrome c oxidase accessory protein CcoG n=1 Tax=Nesiotobacter zosterae TaxID=392721 RepID=UPI0029C2FA4F|nr:cytochrome c oxidase accessory protein CcoG [Pseudovibrio sp. SPO723]MDX5593216.1 cytochrome c oxidase accessory protein CcoG [Pseudovibrio sp. SPO723]